MPDRHNWKLRAACRDEDPEMFFPESSDTRGIARATAVCARCPVTTECENWAQQTRATYGVFAGRFLDRINMRAPGRPPARCGTYAALQAHLRNGEQCDICQPAGPRREEERKALR